MHGDLVSCGLPPGMQKIVNDVIQDPVAVDRSHDATNNNGPLSRVSIVQAMLCDPANGCRDSRKDIEIGIHEPRSSCLCTDYSAEEKCERQCQGYYINTAFTCRICNHKGGTVHYTEKDHLHLSSASNSVGSGGNYHHRHRHLECSTQKGTHCPAEEKPARQCWGHNISTASSYRICNHKGPMPHTGRGTFARLHVPPMASGSQARSLAQATPMQIPELH
jgi:hypothetical protein